MRPKHLVLLLAFCVLASALLAQVVITSTIVGTVTDPQGAVVPGAKVTLTNVDTGVQWKATTDASGDYQFAKPDRRSLQDRSREGGLWRTPFRAR